jgi:hypothetical protein
MIVVLHESRTVELQQRWDTANLERDATHVRNCHGHPEWRRKVRERFAGRRAERHKLWDVVIDHVSIQQRCDVLDAIGFVSRAFLDILSAIDVTGRQQPLDLELVDPEIPKRVSGRTRLSDQCVQIPFNVRDLAAGQQSEDG